MTSESTVIPTTLLRNFYGCTSTTVCGRLLVTSSQRSLHWQVSSLSKDCNGTCRHKNLHAPAWTINIKIHNFKFKEREIECSARSSSRRCLTFWNKHYILRVYGVPVRGTHHFDGQLEISVLTSLACNMLTLETTKLAGFRRHLYFQ